MGRSASYIFGHGRISFYWPVTFGGRQSTMWLDVDPKQSRLSLGFKNRSNHRRGLKLLWNCLSYIVEDWAATRAPFWHQVSYKMNGNLCMQGQFRFAEFCRNVCSFSACHMPEPVQWSSPEMRFKIAPKLPVVNHRWHGPFFDIKRRTKWMAIYACMGNYALRSFVGMFALFRHAACRNRLLSKYNHLSCLTILSRSISGRLFPDSIYLTPAPAGETARDGRLESLLAVAQTQLWHQSSILKRSVSPIYPPS